MKKHTKIYFEYFGYQIPADVFCESCNAPAVDIHHLEPRQMGGSKTKDVIENLMALCRECHIKAETNKEFNNKLKTIHKHFVNSK
jgi:5-methylcytosine-specific restriction endonuclease McrA